MPSTKLSSEELLDLLGSIVSKKDEPEAFNFYSVYINGGENKLFLEEISSFLLETNPTLSSEVYNRLLSACESYQLSERFMKVIRQFSS